MNVSLIVTQPTTVYTITLSHEVVALALKAGIDPLAHPGTLTARQLIEPLQAALDRLTAAKPEPKPEPKAETTETTETTEDDFADLVPVVEACLAACHAYPEAEVHVTA